MNEAFERAAGFSLDYLQTLLFSLALALAVAWLFWVIRHAGEALINGEIDNSRFVIVVSRAFLVWTALLAFSLPLLNGGS